MGAAGFEPATKWSEATHSVQTELSALNMTYPIPLLKMIDRAVRSGGRYFGIDRSFYAVIGGS